METEKILELKMILGRHNELRKTAYRVTKDRHLYEKSQFICRLDDLDKVFVGDSEVILAFDDGTRLAITSLGIRWEYRDLSVKLSKGGVAAHG